MYIIDMYFLSRIYRENCSVSHVNYTRLTDDLNDGHWSMEFIFMNETIVSHKAIVRKDDLQLRAARGSFLQ